MRCYPKLSRLAFLSGLPIFLFASIGFAQPGPEDGAESNSYDVTLRSHAGGEYSGQMTFSRDPDQPEDVQSGALVLNLSLVDGDSPPATTGEGSWWAWRFWFCSFWLAHAETDSSGQVLAFGLACGDRIFGKAGAAGDANLETGRYCIHGQIAEAIEEPDEPVELPVEQETGGEAIAP